VMVKKTGKEEADISRYLDTFYRRGRVRFPSRGMNDVVDRSTMSLLGLRC
jgi:hypothetical protein